MPPPALSILIVARDAADELSGLLEALAPLRPPAFEGEVVVLVDDRTTDRTADVAQARGARTFLGRFEGFGAFKEHGRRLCRGRWLLNLDADELPDADLCRHIRQVVQADIPTAWQLAIRTCVGQRPMRRGPFASEWRLRMFPADLGHWSAEDRVHEVPIVSVPIDRLDGQVIHHSFADLEQLRVKYARYAAIDAARRVGPPSPVRGAARGALRALKYLVLHGGLLLGTTGLQIARCQMAATFSRWTIRSTRVAESRGMTR